MMWICKLYLFGLLLLFSHGSGTVAQPAILVQTEISKKLLDGWPRSFAQTLVIFRQCFPMICWSPDFSCSNVMRLTFVVFEWNTSSWNLLQTFMSSSQLSKANFISLVEELGDIIPMNSKHVWLSLARLERPS